MESAINPENAKRTYVRNPARYTVLILPVNSVNRMFSLIGYFYLKMGKNSKKIDNERPVCRGAEKGG